MTTTRQTSAALRAKQKAAFDAERRKAAQTGPAPKPTPVKTAPRGQPQNVQQLRHELRLSQDEMLRFKQGYKDLQSELKTVKLKNKDQTAALKGRVTRGVHNKAKDRANRLALQLAELESSIPGRIADAKDEQYQDLREYQDKRSISDLKVIALTDQLTKAASQNAKASAALLQATTRAEVQDKLIASLQQEKAVMLDQLQSQERRVQKLTADHRTKKRAPRDPGKKIGVNLTLPADLVRWMDSTGDSRNLCIINAFARTKGGEIQAHTASATQKTASGNKALLEAIQAMLKGKSF